MSSRDSFPKTDAALVAWLAQLKAKAPSHAAALGLTAADLKNIDADAAMLEWVVKALPLIRASAEQFTAYKDGLLEGQAGATVPAIPALPVLPPAPTSISSGLIARNRALAQRMKNATGYTEAIGKDLGLVGAAPAQPEAVPKPTFTATTMPGSKVQLDWVKKRFSGVIIQSRRGGEAAFADLGRDNFSPFDDERAPVTAGAAETREYRMQYLDKDDPVGDWSDVVVVTTKP
jgi:hypothetical protein